MDPPGKGSRGSAGSEPTGAAFPSQTADKQNALEKCGFWGEAGRGVVLISKKTRIRGKH